MNVAQPIIDFWRNLARREQVLAGVVVLAAIIALLVLMMGGDETAPIDASTSAAAQPITERAVPPAPGTIVANEVPTQPVATGAEGPGGVAPIASSGASEGGGDATEDTSEGERLERSQTFAEAPAVVDFPPFSDAVAAAGRDLERVAAAYRECVSKKTDNRSCVNVVDFGVYIENNLHADGKGVTFNKQSSDGHTVVFTIMPNGDCRSVDDQPSCTAWNTNG